MIDAIAYDGFPPAAGLNRWYCLRQAAMMVMERYHLAGVRDWPTPSRPWREGFVVACTATTVTTDATFYGGTDDVSGIIYADPWNGHEEYYGAPSSWYLVVDSFPVGSDTSNSDPERCVKVRIGNWTNAGVLTVADMTDYVASGRIASLGDLVGKPWRIIRGDRGLWWHERTMGGGLVNDYEYAAGFVTAATPASVTVQTYDGRHELVSASWASGELAGLDLLVVDTDGRIKRVTVDDSIGDQLTFPAQSWTAFAGSAFVVVPTGGRAIPGQPKLNAFAWFRGAREGYYTHNPDDAIGSVSMPAKTVRIDGSDFLGGCSGRDVQVWELDVKTDDPVSPADELCGGYPADKHLTPDLFTTWRGLQLAMEGLLDLGTFIQRKGYGGSSQIPLIYQAKAFALAGINSFTATTSTAFVSVSGTIDFAGPIALPASPWGGWRCYWQILDAEGVTIKGGRGFVTSTTLAAQTGTFSWPGDTGKAVVVSLGWDAYEPRMVRRLYEDNVLIPDTDGSPPTPVVPPAVVTPGDCLGLGTWEKRPASTKYLTRRLVDNLWTFPEGFLTEGPESLVDDEIVRFRGDEWGGPGIQSTGGVHLKGDDGLLPYWDRFAVVVRKPETQGRLDAMTSGRATGGSTTQIVTDADLYDFVTYAGVARTETGTFTSGSTSGGADAAKTTGDANCAWKATRFRGFAGPYVGFPLDVLMSGGGFDDPAAVVESRLIAAGDGTTCSLTWDVALSATASGKPYRIQEPWKLNRWIGRTITITNGVTGQTATATVRGNGRHVIFITAIPFAVDEHCDWSIDDPKPGTTWKRQSGAWVKPTGMDTVRLGVQVPEPFKEDSRLNRPTYVKRYGRFMADDAVGPHLYHQLRAMGNVLAHVRKPMSFDNKNSPYGSPERTHQAGESNSPGLNYAAALAEAQADWARDVKNNDTGVMTPDGIPDKRDYDGNVPFAAASVTDDGAGCHTYSMSRRYGYPYTAEANRAGRQFYDVDFYVKGDVTPNGNDGDTCDTGARTFDANGDPVSYRTFTRVETIGGMKDTVVYGSRMGSLTEPNAPPAPGTACTHVRGYRLIDYWAVIRGDVPGGLRFID